MNSRSHKTGTLMIRRYLWIIDMLRSGCSLNCNEIAEKFCISSKTAQRYINVLKDEGFELHYVAKKRGFILLRNNQKGKKSKTKKRCNLDDN